MGGMHDSMLRISNSRMFRRVHNIFRISVGVNVIAVGANVVAVGANVVALDQSVDPLFTPSGCTAAGRRRFSCCASSTSEYSSFLSALPIPYICVDLDMRF